MSRAAEQFRALNERTTPRYEISGRGMALLPLATGAWLGLVIYAMVAGWVAGLAAFALMVVGLVAPMIVLKILRKLLPNTSLKTAPSANPDAAPGAPTQPEAQDGSPFVK
jgi:hypothetical protein